MMQAKWPKYYRTHLNTITTPALLLALFVLFPPSTCHPLGTRLFSRQDGSIRIVDENGIVHLKNGDIYCRNVEWNDVLLFYLLNYITHAFTLKSFPGDGVLYSASLNVLSLIFPYAGILKAWDSIRWSNPTEKSDLEKAKRAGALCIVGRADDWRPVGGERVWCWNERVDKVRGGRVGTWQTLLSEASKIEEEEDEADRRVERVERERMDRDSARDRRRRERRGIDSQLDRAERAESRGKNRSRVRGSPAQARPSYDKSTSSREKRRSERDDRDKRGRSSSRKRRAPRVKIEMKDPHPLLPVNPKHVSLHGQISLPPGYRLLTLPRGIPITKLHPEVEDPQLANTHNIPKSIASIIQLFYAAATLYRARAKQFETYGYASYSLTVIPYMLMTLLNLISHILTPDFPAVYLVRSPVMAEAEARGGVFDGVIGSVSSEALETEDQPPEIPGFPIMFKEKPPSRDPNNPSVVTSADSKPRFTVALDSGVLKSEKKEENRQRRNRKHQRENSDPKVDAIHVLEALVDLPENIARAPQRTDSFITRLFRREHRPRKRRSQPIYISSLGIVPEKPAPVKWYRGKITTGVLMSLMIVIPYLAIYFWTRFRPGTGSTPAQRGWTMAWLATGQFLGVGMVGVWKDWRSVGHIGGWGAVIMVAYCIPAVGGWIEVGKMVREFGVCDTAG